MPNPLRLFRQPTAARVANAFPDSYPGNNSGLMPGYQRKRSRSGATRRSRRIRLGLRTRTRQRNATTSGIGVTDNYDRKMIYRRKAMPRFKKRRWKRFVRKIKYIAEKSLGTRTVVFNNAITATVTGNTSQSDTTIALYSGKSASVHLNDLQSIGRLENTIDPTALDGITVDPTTKFMFQSGVLDITMVNNSHIRQADITDKSVKANLGLEVDVYEIMSRYRPNEDTAPDDIGEMLVTGNSMTSPIDITTPLPGTLTGSSLGISQRGTTPWDLPAAISYFRLKIMKKTKYFLNPGKEVTYQVRDPARHVWTRKRLADQRSFVSSKTRALLVIMKPIAGSVVGSTTGSNIAELAFGITRKYSYKIEGANEHRDLYIT